MTVSHKHHYLGASLTVASLALTSLVAPAAMATEATPTPSTSASPAATTAAEIDQYELFYTQPTKVEGKENTWLTNAGFYWVNEGGDYGVPNGFTFELVSASPELNASIDAAKGNLTTVINQQLDLNKSYTFTVKVTAPDGSSTTEVIRFDSQAVSTGYIAEKYDPNYLTGDTNTETAWRDLMINSAWSGQTLQLEDKALLADVKNIAVTSSDDVVSAKVNQATGELTLATQGFEASKYILADITVTFTFTDGSTSTASVHVRKPANADADRYTAQFEPDRPNPVVVGQTYVAQPKWWDSTDSVELSVAPAGTKAQLVSSDPAMNATIDANTGKVSFHFDTLPAEPTAYNYVVRFTFADGTTTDNKETFFIDETGRSYTLDETLAGNAEFGYDVLKNMKPGNSYVAEPFFYTGRMQRDFFFPEGSTFSIVSGGDGLQGLSIDEKTGKLSFTFPDDAAADFSSVVKVRVRYSDASVSNVDVTLSVNNPEGADSFPVDHTDPLYADDEETPEATDTSEPAETTGSAPAESSEPVENTATSTGEPVEALTADAIVSNNNASDDSSQNGGVSGSYSSSSVEAEQPATLANTGAQNALLIVFTGLVALGAGALLVLRRKH